MKHVMEMRIWGVLPLRTYGILVILFPHFFRQLCIFLTYETATARYPGVGIVGKTITASRPSCCTHDQGTNGKRTVPTLRKWISASGFQNGGIQSTEAE
jgi:hypothetical protein